MAVMTDEVTALSHSIAYDVSVAAPPYDLSEMLKDADRQMPESKNRYYVDAGRKSR